MRNLSGYARAADRVFLGVVVAALAAAACAPASPPAITPAAPVATTAAAPAAPPTSANAVAAPTQPAAGQSAATPAAAPRPDTVPVGRKGGDLVMAVSAEADTLDTVGGGGTPSELVRDMIFDKLVKYTPDLKIVPQLATDWTVNDTAWTFTLRSGVTFQDGTPFNAAAVKAHFDRLIGPEKPNRAGQWTPYLDSVEVVDDHTVRFKTKFPDAFFLNRLASDSGGIESPDSVKTFGKDVVRNPVGTGPFKLKEWTKAVRAVLVRNDTYWGDKAALDQVTIRPIPEAGARAVALESGDVQLADQITPEQVSRIETNSALALSVVPTVREIFLGMHNQKKPFDDVRVRQAISYAIDKQAIQKNIFQDQAVVVGGPFAPAVTGYSPAEGYGYDPARAKQLLAEAGYPNGFSVTLTGPRGRYLKDFETQQAIQQQLKAVGIDVQLDTVEWARYLQLVRLPVDQSEMQMWLDAWSDTIASNVLRQRFGCDNGPPKGNALTGYCNKQVDQLVADAERSVDAAHRDELLKQAQDLVVKDSPSVWGFATKQVAGMSKKLHNPIHRMDEELTVDEHTWLEP